MRTIPEVVEDIKGVLNIVARSEEFTGETLTEIDEFVNEILVIDSVKQKDEESRNQGKLWKVYYNNNEVLLFRGHVQVENGVCYLHNLNGEVEYVIPQTSIHHVQFVED